MRQLPVVPGDGSAAPGGAGADGGVAALAPPPARERAPKALELILNYHCNANCVYCNPPPEDQSRVLPAPAVSSWLARGRRAGATEVTFGGGEPTIRRDLLALVRRAREAGYERVGVKTNGVVLGDPRAVDRLVGAGLNAAHVSYFGATSESHDAVARLPGAAQRRDRAVAGLLAAGVQPEAEVLLTAESLAGLDLLTEHIVNSGVRRINYWLLSMFALPAETLRHCLPRLEETSAPLARQFERHTPATGHELTTFHVPRCFLSEHEDRFRDIADEDLLVVTPEMTFWAEESPYETGEYLSACRACHHFGRCRGIRRDYLAAHGPPPITPRPARRPGAVPREEKAAATVAVTATCNEACVFCTGFDREPVPFEDLLRQVEGKPEVFLAGGEPTLHPRLPEIVAHARQSGARHVALVTNGLRLASPEHLRLLHEAGVDQYLFNLPSHREEVVDRLVQRRGSFQQKMRALSSFAALGLLPRVRMVHVIIRDIFADLPDYARFLAANFPTLGGVELKLAQCLDRPEENAAHVPRLTDVEPPLRQAAAILREAGIRPVPNGFPACFLGEWAASAMEAETARDGRAYTGRVWTAACEGCESRPLCLGARADYVHLYGDGEILARRRWRPGATGGSGARRETGAGEAARSRRLLARLAGAAEAGRDEEALAALEEWLGVGGLRAAFQERGEAVAEDHFVSYLTHRGLKRAERVALEAGLRRAVKFEDLGAEEARALAAELRGRFEVVATTPHAKDGLHLDALAPPNAPAGEEETLVTLYVSTGSEARELADLEARDIAAHTARIGALLSYPPCCVRAFATVEERARREEGELNEDLYRRLAAAGAGPWRWEMNFLSNESLLSHYPCAPDCAASLALARRVAAACDAARSGAGAGLERALRRFFLFFRLAAFVGFEGAASDGETRYHRFFVNRDGDARVRHAGRLLLASLGRALARGNGLRLTPGGIEVLRGAERVASFPFTRPGAVVLLDHTGAGEGGA